MEYLTKSFLVNTVGLPYSVTIIFILICFGIAAFIKERDITTVTFVLGQILLTLGLSALHLYPFYDRFLLFLVAVLLVISKAFDLIYKLLDKRIPKPLPAAIWLILATMFLVPIVKSDVVNFIHPPHYEELKSIMLDFQDSLQPGDTLCIDYGQNRLTHTIQKGWVSIIRYCGGHSPGKLQKTTLRIWNLIKGKQPCLVYFQPFIHRSRWH